MRGVLRPSQVVATLSSLGPLGPGLSVAGFLWEPQAGAHVDSFRLKERFSESRPNACTHVRV